MAANRPEPTVVASGYCEQLAAEPSAPAPTPTPPVDIVQKPRLAEDLWRRTYVGERIRFWLAATVVIPATLGFIYFTQGFGLLVVPILLFGSWFATKLARAHLLRSCVEGSSTT